MTRIMRDSTSSTDIPVLGTALVAGYVNGLYAWNAAEWARFPGAAHVTIDVNGSDPRAAVLDVENGDATVSTAVTWVKARQKLGVANPVIYCNRSGLTPLYNAMLSVGLKPGHGFRVWLATLDGTKTVADMTGVVAVQYAGQSLTGGHYDESIVYDATWFAATPPSPPPPPVMHGLVVVSSLAVTPVTSSDGGKTWKKS
jgi:hypothetical protein